MPKTVDVPGLGVVEFPDDMGNDDISSAIGAHFDKIGSFGVQQAVDLPNRLLNIMEAGAEPSAAGQEQALQERLARRSPTSLTGGVPQFTPQQMMEPFAKIPRITGTDAWFTAALSGALGRPADEDTASTVAALINQGSGFAEFAESPLGITTAAAGATLGPMAQRLIALGFAGDMGLGVKQAAQQAGEISVTGSPQEKKEAYLGLLQNIILPAFLAKHGLEAHGAPAGRIVGREAENFQLPADYLEDLAIRGGRPIEIPGQPLGKPTPQAVIPPNLLQELELMGEPKPPIKPKPPIPNVPRSAFRVREVPETPPEGVKGLTEEQERTASVELQAQQARAAGARTRRQIQAIFPELNNQQAAEVRNAAWGKPGFPEIPGVGNVQPNEPSIPGGISGRGRESDNIVQTAGELSSALREANVDRLQHLLARAALNPEEMGRLASLLSTQGKAALQAIRSAALRGRSISQAAQEAIAVFNREEGTGKTPDTIPGDEASSETRQKERGSQEGAKPSGTIASETQTAQQERELGHASKVPKTTTLYESLSSLAVEGPGQVPAERSVAGVQPEAEEVAEAPQVPLAPGEKEPDLLGMPVSWWEKRIKENMLPADTLRRAANSMGLPPDADPKQIRSALRKRIADKRATAAAPKPEPPPAALVPEALSPEEEQRRLAQELYGDEGEEPGEAPAGAPAPKPPPAPPAAPTAKAEAIPSPADLLDRFDSGDIQTFADLVDEVETLAGDTTDENLAAQLGVAVDAYRDAVDEDYKEFGGRGDPDQYQDEFLAAVKKASGKEKPAAPAAPAPPPRAAEMTDQVKHAVRQAEAIARYWKTKQGSYTATPEGVAPGGASGAAIGGTYKQINERNAAKKAKRYETLATQAESKGLSTAEIAEIEKAHGNLPKESRVPKPQPKKEPFKATESAAGAELLSERDWQAKIDPNAPVKSWPWLEPLRKAMASSDPAKGLEALSSEDLGKALEFHGWAKSGSKAEKIARLVELNRTLKHLQNFSHEIMETWPGEELNKWSKIIGQPTHYAKKPKAVGLANWVLKTKGTMRNAIAKRLQDEAIAQAVIEKRPIGGKTAQDWKLIPALEKKGYELNPKTGNMDYTGEPKLIEFEGQQVPETTLRRMISDQEQILQELEPELGPLYEKRKAEAEARIADPNHPENLKALDRRFLEGVPEEIEDRNNARALGRKRLAAMKRALAGEVPAGEEPLKADMASARRILQMSPAEFQKQAKSFNKINLELGQKATQAEYEELKRLKDQANQRFIAAKLKAEESRSEADLNEMAQLSSMPQFYNEAIAEYERTHPVVAAAEKAKSQAAELKPESVAEPLGRGERFKASDTSLEAKLWDALHLVDRANERWAERRKTGLTDEQLEQALKSENHSYAGSSTHGGWTWRPGRFFGGYDPGGKNEPLLKGKALLNKIRELLEIPYPKEEPKPTEPKPPVPGQAEAPKPTVPESVKPSIKESPEMKASDFKPPGPNEPDLVLIGCGAEKLKTATPVKAQDLYTGILFKARKRFADTQQGRPWMILSALHGAISPNREITPYDVTIEKLSPEDLQTWKAAVRKQVSDYFGGREGTIGKTIEVHAGKEYVTKLESALEGLGITVKPAMESKGIGYQIASYQQGYRRPGTSEAPKPPTAPAERNPFAVATGGEHIVSEDRIRIAKAANLEDVKAILARPDLQKNVRDAAERRLKQLQQQEKVSQHPDLSKLNEALRSLGIEGPLQIQPDGDIITPTMTVEKYEAMWRLGQKAGFNIAGFEKGAGGRGRRAIFRVPLSEKEQQIRKLEGQIGMLQAMSEAEPTLNPPEKAKARIAELEWEIAKLKGGAAPAAPEPAKPAATAPEKTTEVLPGKEWGQNTTAEEKQWLKKLSQARDRDWKDLMDKGVAAIGMPKDVADKLKAKGMVGDKGSGPYVTREGELEINPAMRESVKGTQFGKQASPVPEKRAKATPTVEPKALLPEQTGRGTRNITAKDLKLQKQNLLEQIQSAITTPTQAKKVTFKVPGDGAWTVDNTPEQLRKLQALVDKQFPTTVPTGEPGAPTGEPRAPAVVKDAKPEDLGKVAAGFLSGDESRETLMTAYSDGTQVIATDGRQLLRIMRDDAPGKPTAPVRLNEKGKVVSTESKHFPDWRQIRDDDAPLIYGGLDTTDFYRVLRQAQVLVDTTGEKEQLNDLHLYVNPDRTIGARIKMKNGDSYEHNLKDKAVYMGAYNPDYLVNAINTARRLGNQKVDVYAHSGETGPLAFVGKNHESLVMPMRMSDKGSGRDAANKFSRVVGKAEHPKLPNSKYGPLRSLEDEFTSQFKDDKKDCRTTLQGETFKIETVSEGRKREYKNEIGSFKLDDLPAKGKKREAFIEKLIRPNVADDATAKRLAGQISNSIGTVIGDRNEVATETKKRQEQANIPGPKIKFYSGMPIPSWGEVQEAASAISDWAGNVDFTKPFKYASEKSKVYWRGFSMQQAPHITTMDRYSGELGVRAASAKYVARDKGLIFAGKVLRGFEKGFDGRLGAAITEDNLRDLKAKWEQLTDEAENREEYIERAREEMDIYKEMADDGDPSARRAIDQLRRDIARWERYTDADAETFRENADSVASLVGMENSPFRTEEEYQGFLSSPEAREALSRYIRLWKGEKDDLYRKANDLDPDAPLETRGLQTGARINLKPIFPEDEVTPTTVGRPTGASPKLIRQSATRLKRDKFNLPAKGTAPAYETSLTELMASAYEHEYPIAAQHEFVNRLVDIGLGKLSARERLPGLTIRGEKTHPYLNKFSGEERWIHLPESLGYEYQQIMGLTQASRIPVYTTLGEFLTRQSVVGWAEGSAHTANLLMEVFTGLGPTANPFINSLLKVAGRSDLLLKLPQVFIKAMGDNQEKMVKLAEFGAAKTPYKKGVFGVGWILNKVDQGVRLNSNSLFTRLVESGWVEDTETNRREFVAQVGNYNKALQPQLIRWLRETQVQPFATAAQTFNVMGLRRMAMAPGVKASGAGAAAALRMDIAAGWLGFGVLVAGLNYLVSGSASGPPGTKLGAVGWIGEDGRLHQFDLGLLTGYTRGPRITGLQGWLEAKRLNLSPSDQIASALQGPINVPINMIAGPLNRFATMAATGYRTGYPGVREAEPGVPQEIDEDFDVFKSKYAHSIATALRQANPAVDFAIGAVQAEAGDKDWQEVWQRQFYRWIPKTGMTPETIEALPQIAETGDIRDYAQAVGKQARRIPIGDRMEWLMDRLDRDELSPVMRKRVISEIRRHGVLNHP